MKYNLKYIGILIFCLLLTLTGCSKKRSGLPNQGAAVYYWRTTWNLTQAENKFLCDHKVNYLYLRLFDVVMKEEGPMPEATIHFDNHNYPKNVKIVPVVYIYDNCLTPEMPHLIAQRVAQMGETNDLKFDELQIDCDWRESSRDSYFSFLRALRSELKQYGITRLSSTIRMHQLKDSVPPVDYGVLMCYNTGDLTDYQNDNSILSEKDANPYLRNIGEYDLPLASAYPVFSWQRLFRGSRFICLLHDADLSDTTFYSTKDRRTYTVERTHTLPAPETNNFGNRLMRGDEIKHDSTSMATIKAIKSTIDAKREDTKQLNIIYSINEKDINKYNYEDFEDIFGRR